MGAIVILFAFTIMFWAAYEQKGASLNLFAKRLVDTNAFGFQFPASWLQSLTPLYVILLAPVFARLWVRLGTRQPSSPAKFSLGLLAIGMAFCLLVRLRRSPRAARSVPCGWSVCISSTWSASCASLRSGSAR